MVMSIDLPEIQIMTNRDYVPTKRTVHMWLTGSELIQECPQSHPFAFDRVTKSFTFIIKIHFETSGFKMLRNMAGNGYFSGWSWRMGK